MKKKIILFIFIGIIIGSVIGIKAATVIQSNQVIYEDKTLDNVLGGLFDELYLGKQKLAESITNKGIETTSDNTLEEMADNIDLINTTTNNLVLLAESYDGINTLDMDLSKYSHIIVEYTAFKGSTQYTNNSKIAIFPVPFDKITTVPYFYNGIYDFIHYNNGIVIRREVTITENNITFGSTSDGAGYNLVLRVQKIYGLIS